jgi:peptidyl-prolyl cis-trans isomerase SurA
MYAWSDWIQHNQKKLISREKVEERMKAFTLAVLVFIGTGIGQAQVLDRIVAVVENDFILQSELDAQVRFFILNNKLDQNTPGLKQQVLQAMINEKLIIAKAIEDSVTVTDEEVQQQLDAVVQQRVQQVGSESRLEEVYGMPLSRIKREYRDEMRKNLLSQRLQQQRFGTTQVGRYEVEEFFAAYKDSLPPVPEEVELAHIFMKPKPNEAAKAATRAKMQALLDSLTAGVPFADLARRHSQDPGSASLGGDLGLVRRGQFVKEFESAAFSLAEGQTSGIVETELGFHIIHLLERRGDAVHAQHILMRFERSDAGDSTTVQLLDSLRMRVTKGESFAELAKRYSEDNASNLIGGSLGTLNLEQLGKDWYPTVSQLKPGEVSPPARLSWGNTYGYHIVLMRSRTPAHTMNLQQDYQKIEAIALNYKRTREYQAWLDDLKTKMYWKSYL